MSDESGSSKMAFFLAGLGIGAILALVFAPKSGEETRQYITGKAGEGKDFVAARSKEIREQAEGLVERGKDLASKQKEKLSAAFEAGRQAYQEEKSKAR